MIGITSKPTKINMKKLFTGGVGAFLFLCFSAARAQLSLSAQYRMRSEFRDGQGAPLPKGTNPAFFTSQRTRLSAGFSGYRLKLGVTVQDARVWGQDVSTINRTTTQDNNGLLLHEAWAEVMLTDTTVKNKSVSVKLGRQEWVYDDSRLLGNLDWLQQARRHDAVLFKYEQAGWMLHAAAAFNQNKENASGTVYNSTPPGNYTGNTNGSAMYKSLEFVYLGKKLQKGNASFLFLADQFSKYHIDNGSQVKTWDMGVWNRMTGGFYFNNSFDALTLTAAAYYQFGKNYTGQKLSAGLLSAAFQYSLSKQFSAGLGADFTSGGSLGSTSHAFDPLYGTPHKFWGLMDYFYAASGFGNRGLQDYYLKTKWKPADKWQLTADVHQFFSASAVAAAGNTGSLKRNFGTEADITGTYALTKMIAFEAGYSHFFATSSLSSAAVKNVPDARLNSNWAYLMITLKPEYIFTR
jgi:hypothetical protein